MYYTLDKKGLLIIFLVSTMNMVQSKKGEYDTFPLLAPSYNLNNLKITEVKDKGKIVYVAVVEDTLSGRKFCVKQYHSADRVFLSLKEVLVSRIAESVNMPVNQVRLIFANFRFPGKKYEERIATLHNFMPGNRLKSMDKFLEVDIKQFSQPKGVLGISREIINHMALSQNLAKIVALDTFTGDTNHSRGNIFFDEVTKEFYGIDLKRSYRKNLAILAYENIKKMAQRGFNSRELAALRIYRDTLKALIVQNTPGNICKHLDELVDKVKLKKQVRYFGDESFYVMHKYPLLSSKSMRTCKMMIFQNYEYSKKLAELLDTILHK